jgi:phage shock protein PspC (stress-responsive transcriptional regulator)
MTVRRLTRSNTQGKIAGVCAGMANYFDVDVVLVRLAWVVLAILGAIVGGVIAYVAAWVVMPIATEPDPVSSRRRLTLSDTDRQIAGVCGGMAEYFEVDATLVRLGWCLASIFLGAVVFGVIAYLIAWFLIPRPTPVVLSPAAPASA